MIDIVVLSLIALMAVFGLIRGIVSQVMALAGLVLAYLIAPSWGPTLGGFVQEQLSSSRFMAEKLSVLMVGVLIYLSARLFGLGFEKILVNRVREFKKLNRLGGAFMGGLKGLVMVSIVFFFLALVPAVMIQDWFPKLIESRTYQLAARYNPMGDVESLERMRHLRHVLRDPQKMKKLRDDPAAQELFSKHQVGNPLRDHRFMKSLHEGDFEKLKQRDEVEALMKDDRLEALLAELEKPSSEGKGKDEAGAGP